MLQFQGPVVLYPINRVAQTPLDVFTVVDVMRNTLGVGPCEHILDMEGQKSEYKGRATCSVRDTLTPIYKRSSRKRNVPRSNATLDEGLTFVKHIRGRITRYVEFGQKMRRVPRGAEEGPPGAGRVHRRDGQARGGDRRQGGGPRREDQDAG